MWHLCMELTQQRSHSLLGLPHHVAPWEQHWNGGDLMKQNVQVRSSLKDASMDTKPRVVQCPKCRALLHEPPLGNPFYECGGCFATLQAKHATQEDIDIRLQQKTLLWRMENEKNAKSVSSEDGYKVFTSESSSEAHDREEHVHSREGSPSWSPSRWESPLYGPKPGHSSLQAQQQMQGSVEKPQYYPQSAAPRSTKQDLPSSDNVEALGHNLHRLGVEDSNEAAQRHSRASASSKWANGDGAHHVSMRRPSSEEFLADMDVEGGHHSQAYPVQKSVSFNHAVGVANASKKLTSRGDRAPSFSKDVHQVTRVSPSESPQMRDSVHRAVDNFLSARYDGRSQHMADGFENQRDMYAAPDILEYETSDHLISVGDGDAHQAMVVENHSRPSSGELDSYVVLDHRVTRPGAYQRSSSASRHGHLNTAQNHATDGHERYHSDGDNKPSSHSQSASKVQQRPPSYHVQQASHVSYQSSTFSPPHYTYDKPPAGLVSHEPNLQNGATKTYPFLPRPDEAPFVHCQHCEQLLAVPANLPSTQKAYQKLRCGACLKISVFFLATDDHVSATTTSPRGHCNSGTRSDIEAGDRGHPSIAPGGSHRLPPSARNIPRVPSGSKLSALSSAANGTTMSSGYSNLYPATGAIPTRSNSSSHYSDGMSYRRSQSAYGPNGEHVMSSYGPRASSGSDHEGHHQHDGRFFHTSSESDNDSPRQRPPRSLFKGEQFYASSRMPLDRHVAQQYSKDEGYMQEANMTSSMSLKGIIKKGVKELTKNKQNSSNHLYRRRVTVNGSPVPDVLVKRAEGLAGPIHPGSYWYDSQAGFWGLSGGPCLGIIPPHIEELSTQPLSRHCSGGRTGVVVNGRELHKSDYDLLVRRGLPPTPGMTYFVDIEGHVKEAGSGFELRGLGPLAPTLEQSTRGHGMWVPGSSKVA